MDFDFGYFFRLTVEPSGTAVLCERVAPPADGNGAKPYREGVWRGFVGAMLSLHGPRTGAVPEAPGLSAAWCC